MMTETDKRNQFIVDPSKPMSAVLIMVCIYIFLFIERPWESIRYLEGIQIERIYAIALIIVAFLAGRFKIVSSTTNKWVYGLLAMHFILAPFAYRTEFAIDQGVEYAKMVVLYLLMVSLVDDEHSLKILVKAYVFSTMFYSLHSLWEYHNGRHVWTMGISRMMGADSTFSDPNAFGASLVLSLPFAYALFRSEISSRLRQLYCGYFGIVVLCVVLTGSRSASVALIVLLLMWSLLQQGKNKFVILAAMLLAFSTVWINMPAEKQERIRSIWDKDAGPENAHESTDGRRLGFNAGLEMFLRAPLTGIGAGGKNFVEYRKNRLDGVPEQAHNLYAEVLGELGLGGALFFIGLVASNLCSCLKVRQHYHLSEMANSFCSELSRAIIVSVVLLLIFGLAGHNFYRPLWLWLSAWAGGLMQILNQKESSISKTEVY